MRTISLPRRDDKLIFVFISHADEERKVANSLKIGLENLGLEAFLAHDDIEGGIDWKPFLINKLEECDLFIPLLSKAYRLADFTDQEAGIAFALEKPMVPISLDGTMPYGFINKWQAIKCLSGFDDNTIHKIYDLISIHTEKGQREINSLIAKLARAERWVDANTVARSLFVHTKFTDEQINHIARAFVENSEVSGSWTAGPRSLEALQKNWKRILPSLQRKLRPYIEDKEIEG